MDEQAKERRDAELSRLREAEQELRAIIDSVPTPIAYLDPSGRYRSSNQAHREWHRKEEIQGESLASLAGPAIYEGASGLFNDALAGRVAQGQIEVRFAGIGPRWVEFMFTPRRAADGAVVGVVAILHDISQRRREDEEREALLAREKEARAAAELANQRLALLAEVSAIFSSSLDLSGSVDQIAHLMVRQFVEYCCIELADEEADEEADEATRIHGLTVVHRDPDKVSLLQEIRRRLLQGPRGQHLLCEAVRSGEAQRCPWSDEAFLRQIAADDEHLALMRQVELDEVLLAPMMARGKVVGVMQFGRQGRTFSAEDQSFCDELARRAAGSVDNARAYRAERAARLSAERLASTLSRLQEITSSLSGALTPAQVAEVVVREAVAALQGASGVVVVLAADGDELEVVGHNGIQASMFEPFRRIKLDEPLPLVQAYLNCEPEVVETLDDYCARYPEDAAKTATATGTRALICLPLLLDGVAIGVFGLMFREDRRLTVEEHGFAATLARQCAQALDRARLYEAELHTNECLRLLAQAGDVLSSSLEYETTLHNLTSLAMPMLGDFCFFDVMEGAEVRRIARAHDDPALEALLGKMRWERAQSEDFNLSALSSGHSGYHPDIDDRWMQRVATSPEDLSILRALGLCSMITVPMIARRETLGALTLCFSVSGRHHTSVQLVLAEELAQRAATAIENSRLHRASQEATLRAQEATRLSEQANRAKDEFLGVVSHELRTPLNAILGWAQLLSGERVKEPAVVQKGVTVIERNARAQVKLIEDILDVSRIISGKLRIDLRAMDLEPVLRACVEVVRPAADAKGVELIVSAVPGAIVSGDPDRLQQVVWNLLSNAVKFTPKDGAVEILLTRGKRSARIVVRDSGKGIDPEFLPHVFERFRQADSSTTRHHGGLGLGLSIVRHVVELHGGSVSAESEGLGRGATFTVKLPLRVDGAQARDPASRATLDAGPALPTMRLDGLKVLVVDDEFDAREMIATLLQVAGAEVSVVDSPVEALERLSTFAADVLVSDVGMPGDDGYALIRRIRGSGARYARIPALALTAYAAPEDARRAALAGFHAHLPKPAEPTVLTALVASLGGRGEYFVTPSSVPPPSSHKDR